VIQCRDKQGSSNAISHRRGTDGYDVLIRKGVIDGSGYPSFQVSRRKGRQDHRLSASCPCAARPSRRLSG